MNYKVTGGPGAGIKDDGPPCTADHAPSASSAAAAAESVDRRHADSEARDPPAPLPPVRPPPPPPGPGLNSQRPVKINRRPSAAL